MKKRNMVDFKATKDPLLTRAKKELDGFREVLLWMLGTLLISICPQGKLLRKDTEITRIWLRGSPFLTVRFLNLMDPPRCNTKSCTKSKVIT